MPIIKCRESTHSCTARVCFFHSWAVRDLNDWFRHRGHEYSKTQFCFQKQVQNHTLTLNDAHISYHKEKSFQKLWRKPVLEEWSIFLLNSESLVTMSNQPQFQSWRRENSDFIKLLPCRHTLSSAHAVSYKYLLGWAYRLKPSQSSYNTNRSHHDSVHSSSELLYLEAVVV